MAQGAAASYFCFGLHISSELLLPELGPPAATPREAPAVTIRLGDVAPSLDGARHVGPTYQVGDDDYLLDVRDVGRYRVRGGSEIIVAPDDKGSERDLRVFLLGTALGALCHQRRLLPLHASVIVSAGRAIAFAGRSRAGKSTLAAFFGDRGYPVLADDICAVSLDEAGRPVVWPGLPRVKLWRDALAAFGRDADGLERVREGLQKYHLPNLGNGALGPTPLAKLYVLHEARPPRHPGIAKLAGMTAFNEVLDQTYRRHLVQPMGLAQVHFERCAALLRHAEVYTAHRRWGFDSFAEEAALIERHFLEASPQ